MYKFQDLTPSSGHFRTNFKISGQRRPGHPAYCLDLVDGNDIASQVMQVSFYSYGKQSQISCYIHSTCLISWHTTNTNIWSSLGLNLYQKSTTKQQQSLSYIQETSRDVRTRGAPIISR